MYVHIAEFWNPNTIFFFFKFKENSSQQKTKEEEDEIGPFINPPNSTQCNFLYPTLLIVEEIQKIESCSFLYPIAHSSRNSEKTCSACAHARKKCQNLEM